ncbi:CPK12 [Symbiodinium sp. KB8]|nr:CPK12 [Symbiodinium sp. KB8]
MREAYHFPSASPLGVGSYGTVMLATHRRTGIERAVKRIDKQRFLPGEVEAIDGERGQHFREFGSPRGSGVKLRCSWLKLSLERKVLGSVRRRLQGFMRQCVR